MKTRHYILLLIDSIIIISIIYLSVLHFRKPNAANALSRPNVRYLTEIEKTYLTTTRWRLVSIEALNEANVETLHNEPIYPIQLSYNGNQFSGQIGCNSYQGRYKLKRGPFIEMEHLSTFFERCFSNEFQQMSSLYLQTLQAKNYIEVTSAQFIIHNEQHRLIFEPFDQKLNKAVLTSIYQTVLYEVIGLDEKRPFLLNTETTYNYPDTSLPNTIRSVQEIFEDQTIAIILDDFYWQNERKSQTSHFFIEVSNPIVIQNPRQIESIFAEPEGWTQIAERYSEDHIILSFSQIGFNGEQNKALLYYQLETPTFYGGYYTLLVKQGQTDWVESITFQLWEKEPRS